MRSLLAISKRIQENRERTSISWSSHITAYTQFCPLSCPIQMFDDPVFIPKFVQRSGPLPVIPCQSVQMPLVLWRTLTTNGSYDRKKGSSWCLRSYRSACAVCSRFLSAWSSHLQSLEVHSQFCPLSSPFRWSIIWHLQVTHIRLGTSSVPLPVNFCHSIQIPSVPWGTLIANNGSYDRTKRWTWCLNVLGPRGYCLNRHRLLCANRLK